MPFIVQCPHPDCRKFMLLEEHRRGTTVECLVCERIIVLEPSGSDEGAKPPPLDEPSGAASPSAKRQEIAACPSCKTPLRLPPSHKGKAIRCPACKHVFRP
jgi:uncharacterized protein YbaR (Trm112 family)